MANEEWLPRLVAEIDVLRGLLVKHEQKLSQVSLHGLLPSLIRLAQSTAEASAERSVHKIYVVDMLHSIVRIESSLELYGIEEDPEDELITETLSLLRISTNWLSLLASLQSDPRI